MKKLIILFSTFYLVVFSVLGQENSLYYEVQQAKNRNTYFENTSLPAANFDIETLKNFIDPNEVFFFGNISLDLRNSNVQAMNLQLSLGNKNMVLELIEVPEPFYDYIVTTSDGQSFPANRDIKHYRGIVQNENNSLVAITFYENEILGLVCTDEGNFNIAKDKLSGKHIFYNENNLKEKISMSCGTITDNSISDDIDILLKEENLSNINRYVTNKYVRFYVETEYDIYQNKGSVSAVELFITGLFNQVAALYQNEQILTRISNIYVWTSNDPYTGPDIYALIEEFQNVRTSFVGDLGMLLTFRGTLSGAANGINGLRTSVVKYKLAVAMVNNIVATVPTHSRTVKIVTHEFGHLLNSDHTHACVWGAENDTLAITGIYAIDGCFKIDGYCDHPGIPVKGTIMSYCDHTICYDKNGNQIQCPGVDFTRGFGVKPGTKIRNYVAAWLCTTDFINKTVTGHTKVNGCETLNVANVTISNVIVDLNAEEAVVIKPGFHAVAGSNVRISIDPNHYGQAKSISLSNINNSDETTLADLEKLSIIEQADSDLIIFPNPNDGNFTLKIIGEINPYTIEIFNNIGGMIGTVNCNDEVLSITRTDLNAGVYYVKLTMGDKIVVKKFVVQ